MKTIVTSQDLLILRDGRPFGADQNFGGTGYNWPMPQTIAGMVRTVTGNGVCDDFFTGPDSEININRILSMALKKILPYAKQEGRHWEPVFPIPADWFFFDTEDKISVKKLTYEALNENEGTDIQNRDWLVGFLSEKAKPSVNIPLWLFQDAFLHYVRGESFDTPVNNYDMGLKGPVTETRIHNGIESQSLTARDGKLFSNYGIYMHSIPDDSPERKSYTLGVGFSVQGTSEFCSIPEGDAFLGGERHVVTIKNTNLPYPNMPSCFNNKKYLKIILLTHGDFGDWCPRWLMPALNADKIDWVDYPGTDIKLRLRSAVVRGWDSVSGWDCKKKKPKAMKKLLRPGTVFLIELLDPTRSEKLASLLWGNALVGGSIQSEYDGYNHVMTALVKPDVKERN